MESFRRGRAPDSVLVCANHPTYRGLTTIETWTKIAAVFQESSVQTGVVAFHKLWGRFGSEQEFFITRLGYAARARRFAGQVTVFVRRHLAFAGAPALTFKGGQST